MSQTVLIADDEPNIVAALDYLLRREGFAVLVARDGPAALDTIRRDRPALAVLDGVMPGLSGFQVCETVRGDPALAGTRLLMLTVKARDTDIARGMGAGADAYLTKPFSTRDLVARIRELLA